MPGRWQDSALTVGALVSRATVPGSVERDFVDRRGRKPADPRLLSVLVRPRLPSLAVAIVVAVAVIALETPLVAFLQAQAPGEAFAVIYLLGVVVVSTVSGLALSVATSLASAVVLAFVQHRTGGHFAPFDLQNDVIVVVFLIVALCTNFVAGRARARGIEAGQRSREAEDAAAQLQESRDRLSALADLQEALRRVATLVALGVGSAEVFSTVADEMRRCLGVMTAGLLRFEDGGGVIVASSYPDGQRVHVGEFLKLDGDTAAAMVLRTGLAARMDSYENAAGSIAAISRQLGVGATVAVPVVVEGRLWGVAYVAASVSQHLPPDTEARLGDFAELVATAIADAAARDALQASRDAIGELAEQQAALRRVATLVAYAVEPPQLFKAVAEEMRRCLHTISAGLWRFETSGEITLLAAAAEPPLLAKLPPPGTRTPIEGDNLASTVRATGRPARIDAYEHADGEIAARLLAVGIRAAVGVPVTVNGRLWGHAAVASAGPAMPADTEQRISDFAELVATAIANAATRGQIGELAKQQAALRRVATLVARGVDPTEVFNAVAEEIVRCLEVDVGALWRYEPDGSAILMAVSHPPGSRFLTVGERLTLEGDSAAARVLRTGTVARIRHDDAVGSVANKCREDGIRSAVGAPVIVDGQLWGVALVAAYGSEDPPPGTEERIGDFADLVATALANAATRDELIASRARIVAAADDARRRLERDLHDGAQQRLVSLGLQLRLVERSVPSGHQDLREQLSGLASGLTAVSSELQEISRGIHPAILSTGGLGPALKTLALRSPIPVNIEFAIEARLPDSVEVAAYFIVAEALTNAAKYSHASEVNVCAKIEDAHLDLSIRDDGIGGADSRKGSGLVGLKDRVEVLGGHMTITSPPGSGTSLYISIPVTS